MKVEINLIELYCIVSLGQQRFCCASRRPCGKVDRVQRKTRWKTTHKNMHTLKTLHEVPIARPTNSDIQRVAFSMYKNMHTLKTMIVITPRGGVPIARPTNSDIQRVAFSTYKNMHTLKTMTDIIPRGVVSYVGPSYGGSASDRQLIERPSLLKDNMLSHAKMSDRSIVAQDTFPLFYFVLCNYESFVLSFID